MSMADSEVADAPPAMPGFRRCLEEKGLSADALTLGELERSTADIVRFCLKKVTPLRPSSLARDLRAMAKALQRAATAASRIGEDGMLHLLVASYADREPDKFDPHPHVEYLTRMARWAERAAQTAALNSRSERDNKGGRTPNENLRSMVVLLMQRYQELLSWRPTHAIDSHTGMGNSPFDVFVKEALARFGPEGLSFEPRLIDDAIRRALESRDFEPFTPPRLPSP